MVSVRKTAVCASFFGVVAAFVVGCSDGEVHVSSDTAKDLACSSARASNQAGAISDDMRKQIAKAIADSVSDETVKALAQRVHDSDTPEKLRAAYESLITKACGPSAAK